MLFSEAGELVLMNSERSIVAQICSAFGVVAFESNFDVDSLCELHGLEPIVDSVDAGAAMGAGAYVAEWLREGVDE